MKSCEGRIREKSTLSGVYPLQAGVVPHFKDLTPIQREATLQPEQAEVWPPLSRQKLTVVNTDTT